MMETHLILVGLLSICSLSFGQECNQQLVENIDFRGDDIRFDYSPDTAHCQHLCTQDPSCLFFTFVRADWNVDDRHFRCYLKKNPSGIPTTRIPLNGVTSGFSLKPCNPDPQPCLSQVYQNIDFLGADYRTLFTADYEECQRTCTHDPACQFFTFVKEAFQPERIRYKCHLKFSWAIPMIPTVLKQTGVVSGFFPNAQITQFFNEDCETKLFPNTDIPGNDFLNLPAASPEHCQTMCSAHPLCTYSSFDSNGFRCYMKDNKNEMVISAKQGVTSGIPAHFCQLNNSWASVLHENVEFRGPFIRFVLLDDVDTCRRTCIQDSNCQFWTYVNERFPHKTYWRHCYLKRAITLPAPPKVTKLANVVSGFHQRNCASPCFSCT
uniref:Skin mucus lectin n=1 Tax=Platycephalus indicus TaxID=270568 RepID=D0VX37_9TELE|nr:skin mucus lectin [Platycephalus indicus]